MISLDFKSVFNIVVITISFLVTALCFAILFIIVTGKIDMETKQEAIEKGYALHCPKDGEFAWKGECE